MSKVSEELKKITERRGIDWWLGTNKKGVLMVAISHIESLSSLLEAYKETCNALIKDYNKLAEENRRLAKACEAATKGEPDENRN